MHRVELTKAEAAVAASIREKHAPLDAWHTVGAAYRIAQVWGAKFSLRVLTEHGWRRLTGAGAVTFAQAFLNKEH